MLGNLPETAVIILNRKKHTKKITLKNFQDLSAKLWRIMREHHELLRC